MFFHQFFGDCRAVLCKFFAADGGNTVIAGVFWMFFLI
jgi:hypothetical protein